MKTLLLSAAMIAVSTASAVAQTVFIDDAKIVTNTAQGILEKADIIVRDGRIETIGETLSAPADATIISGDDQWVTAGLFQAYSQIGLVDISAEGDSNDIRASASQTSVADRAADSFNPKTTAMAVTMVEGVTHMAIIPQAGRNIFGGTGAVVTTSGEFDSILDADALVSVQLGEDGTDLAGGSRAAAMSQLWAALNDAGAYPARYKSPMDGDTLSRRDAAALSPAARGQIPIIITAHRAVDIMNIIALKRDYGNLDIIIAGAAEAWLVADAIAEAGLKIMVDPHENLPLSFDQAGTRADNVILLDQAGVDYAIMSWTQDPTHNGRVLPQHAGNAVGNGLAWDKAFAAITTTPARWFDVNTGTIEPGANTLVVWDGDPLEVTVSPKAVMINGAMQTLESRQTKLRDRYNPSRADDRPHKYR